LPRSQGRRTLEVVDVGLNILPNAHRLVATFARWHSAVLTVARGSLEASVEKVEADVDGMSRDDGLRIRGHHHTCSSHHLLQGTSYHQKGVKRHEKHVGIYKN
jgi:hypothetical protein